jgi:hypothetical protein
MLEIDSNSLRPQIFRRFAAFPDNGWMGYVSFRSYTWVKMTVFQVVMCSSSSPPWTLRVM